MKAHGEFNFEVPTVTGAQLRDDGITRAVEHADRVTDAWSNTAYWIALRFMADRMRSGTRQFMIEEVREYSKDILPEPPSRRAWGAIATRLVKEGKISRVGFRSVKNPRAHCAPCSVWEIVSV